MSRNQKAYTQEGGFRRSYIDARFTNDEPIPQFFSSRSHDAESILQRRETLVSPYAQSNHRSTLHLDSFRQVTRRNGGKADSDEFSAPPFDTSGFSPDYPQHSIKRNRLPWGREGAGVASFRGHDFRHNKSLFFQDEAREIDINPHHSQLSFQVGPMSLFSLVAGLVVLGVVLFFGGFMTALVMVPTVSVAEKEPKNIAIHASNETHHTTLDLQQNVHADGEHSTKLPPLLPVHQLSKKSHASDHHDDYAKEGSGKDVKPSLPVKQTDKNEHHKEETKHSSATSDDKSARPEHTEEPDATKKVSWEHRHGGAHGANLQSILDARHLSLPYVVQLGNFSHVEDAKNKARLMQKKGYHAYVIAAKASHKNQPQFRVRVGGFSSPQEAIQAAQAIRQSEKVSVAALAKVAVENVVM